MRQDVEGMKKLFGHFSFPGGAGSHMTPEVSTTVESGLTLGTRIATRRRRAGVLDLPRLWYGI